MSSSSEAVSDNLIVGIGVRGKPVGVTLEYDFQISDTCTTLTLLQVTPVMQPAWFRIGTAAPASEEQQCLQLRIQIWLRLLRLPLREQINSFEGGCAFAESSEPDQPPGPALF